MSVSSETQLCNNALLRIGAATISSLADGNLTANVCQQLYSPTRDSLLQQHFWKFALKRTSLAEDATAPDFEWSHRYPLPADYIRLKSVYARTSDFKHEGQYILTNQAAPLNIVYVASIVDTTKFDPLFTKALTLLLAIEIAERMGRAGSEMGAIMAEYEKALQLAKRVNSQDDIPDSFSMSAYQDARYNGYTGDPGISEWFY